jgi:hypothetical protein
VICFESVVVTARRQALADRGLIPQPLPRQRTARWILAPRATWSAWRCAALERPMPTPTTARPQHHPNALAEPVVEPDTRAGIGQQDERLQLIVTALRDSPDTRAPALLDVLSAQGLRISLRTVQRLRATALGELARDPSPAAESGRE